MRRAIISKWAQLLAEAFPAPSREILSGKWPSLASAGHYWWCRRVLVECLCAKMLIFFFFFFFPLPAVNSDHKCCSEKRVQFEKPSLALSDHTHSFTSQSAAQNVIFISFLAACFHYTSAHETSPAFVRLNVNVFFFLIILILVHHQ